MSLPQWSEIKRGLDKFYCSFGGVGGNCYASWRHGTEWIEIQARSIDDLKRAVMERRQLLENWKAPPAKEQPVTKPQAVKTGGNPWAKRKFA